MMEIIAMNRVTGICQKPLKNYLIFFTYLLPVLTVFQGYSAIISGVLLMIVISMSLSERFYLLFPILIVFYGQLVVPGGIVIYRIFTLLYLLNIFINGGKVIRSTHLSILLITISYALFVLVPVDLRAGIMVIFDVVFLLIYSTNSLNESYKIKLFFKYITLAVVMAGIYGIINSTNNMNTFISVDGTLQSIFRVIGTFEDPNYFGLYINVGIFSNVIMNFFNNNSKRIILLIFLYYLLFSTLSLTGILCNLIGLFLYFIFIKKLSLKYIISLLLLVALVTAFLNSEIVNNIPVFNDFLVRFNSMQTGSAGADLGRITSGRSSLWSDNWEFFRIQTLNRVVLGGNRIVPLSIDFQKFSGISHLEYLDQLLNVGLIGFAFLNIFFLSTIFKYIIRFIETNETEFIMIIFAKYVWLFYGFSLTLFLDSRFMIFFLM